MSLISLPNELLIDVASYLPVASPNALLKTNHKLNYDLTATLFARALDPTTSKSETNSLAITQHILTNTDSTTTALGVRPEIVSSLLQLITVNGSTSIVKAYIQHIPTLIIQAHTTKFSNHQHRVKEK